MKKNITFVEKTNVIWLYMKINLKPKHETKQ